ncbi:MAG: vanadium-dependent haloperoxidase [Chloroflexota bacterium]
MPKQLRLNRRFLSVIVVICSICVFSISILPAQAQTDAASPLASELDAAPATAWIQLLYQRVFADKVNPPAAARLYAYAGITMYQAVLPGIPGNRSLAGQLTDMPETPAIEAGVVYDWSAAATGALSVVIPAILPDNPDTTQAVDLLRQKQINAYKRDLAEDVVDRSITYGESVAQVILDWESTDGAKEAEAKNASYVIPDTLDGYVLTTEGTKPTEPYWGEVRPFGIPSSSACDRQQDMPYSTDKDSTFYAQALEVKNTGDHLTPSQEDIINFWVDTPGITGTPGGHWMLIAAQVIEQLDLKLDKTAETFATVGVAVGDAFISGWNTKYIVMLIRPVSYIQRYIDPKWQPYVQTPPFPEFISGHSIVSESAAHTLTYLFGTQKFTDDSERFRNLGRRSYTSFEQASNEAGMSRLYGGIHYRTGVEKGWDQGRCVADFIHSRVQLHGD